MSINIKVLNSFVFLALFSLSAYTEMEMNAIESVTIVGSKDDLAGAASVVSNEDLEKIATTLKNNNYGKYLFKLLKN